MAPTIARFIGRPLPHGMARAVRASIAPHRRERRCPRRRSARRRRARNGRPAPRASALVARSDLPRSARVPTGRTSSARPLEPETRSAPRLRARGRNRGSGTTRRGSQGAAREQRSHRRADRVACSWSEVPFRLPPGRPRFAPVADLLFGEAFGGDYPRPGRIQVPPLGVTERTSGVDVRPRTARGGARSA